MIIFIQSLTKFTKYTLLSNDGQTFTFHYTGGQIVIRVLYFNAEYNVFNSPNET